METEAFIKNIDFENIDKHPNILIAARFWDDRRYHAAKVCYKFMRMIDDHIDDRKALDKEISCIEKEELSEKVHNWIECLDMSADHDPFFVELTDTISTFKIPLQLFHNFARSMIHDINHNGFSSMGQFIDYAEGASVAPASIFVHLSCLSEKDGTYYIPDDLNAVELARPCALFSYMVHIIRDFQEDQLNNLNCFPADILEKHNLHPSDLKKIALGAPVTLPFRNVIREYYNLALAYGLKTLEVLDSLQSSLNGRYLLSLHVIYNLYKMVFERIDIEHGSFTTEELNPTPAELKEKVLEVASGW